MFTGSGRIDIETHRYSAVPEPFRWFWRTICARSAGLEEHPMTEYRRVVPELRRHVSWCMQRAAATRMTTRQRQSSHDISARKRPTTRSRDDVVSAAPPLGLPTVQSISPSISVPSARVITVVPRQSG